MDFYAHLLNKYEVVFGFLIEDFLYWPSALPGDDFAACTCVGCGAHEFSDQSLKVRAAYWLDNMTATLVYFQVFIAEEFA